MIGPVLGDPVELPLLAIVGEFVGAFVTLAIVGTVVGVVEFVNEEGELVPLTE